MHSEDWADAQADLSLRWAHSHFVGFVMRQLKFHVTDNTEEVKKTEKKAVEVEEDKQEEEDKTATDVRILNYHMSPVKRICVFEHSVMTNFNCACPAI